MGSLTTCLKKTRAGLAPGDEDAIVNRAAELRDGGMKASEAGLKATRDLLAEAIGERSELRAATADQKAPAVAVIETPQPESPTQVNQGAVNTSLNIGDKKHPATVMGSRLLAVVSKTGGLDPALLSEFSERVPTGRSDKNGSPTMMWRNPMVPGVGKLFRSGGTRDYSRLGELMEEYGYLPPGSVERDYKEAGEQAKAMIKAALDRKEVLTLDEQQAAAETAQDAEREAYYAELDAEARSEAEAEREAIIAESSAPVALIDNTADDDVPWDLADGHGSQQETADFLGITIEELQREQRLQGPLRQDEQAKAGSGEGDRAHAGRAARPPPEAGGTAPRQDAGRDASPARGQEDEGLTLQAQTPADLKAKAEHEQAAADLQRKQRAAEQERLRKEAEGRDTRARADQTVDDFELGQSAEQQLSGMGDLFAEAPAATTAPKPLVSKNTIFTDDVAEKARALLKRKLGQINSGVDPEMMQAGITMAGWHIENGARKFADFARAMLADLGEVVRPYLKSWYMGAIFDPRLAGMQGLSGAAEVEAADVAAIKAQADNAVKEKHDVPAADAALERDRQDAEPGDSAVDGAVQGDGPSPGASAAGGRSGSSRRGRPDDQGVPARGPSLARELGDQPLHRADGADRPAELAAGTRDGERSDDPGIVGLAPDAAAGAKAARPAAGVQNQAAIERQRAADSVAIAPGLDNIRATLPFLHGVQQEDVHKAEQRFAKPDGYGYLLTNGTGTGKTLSGLGTVKRFARQGKTNTLILVPDDKIMADWVMSGQWLGLKLTPLASTKDKGRGITITTYANVGQNDALAQRQWDLIVPDEAHTLMQDADGTPTTFLKTVWAISMHPRGVHDRFAMLNRDDLAKQRELSQRIEGNTKILNNPDTTDMMVASLRRESERAEKELEALTAKLRAELERVKAEVAAAQGEKRPRLLALSATPFAYEKTVDWAAGYLFDYGPASEDGRSYNRGDAREQFFMQHFGYRMRYNKLTEPDAKVDRGLMQRQFNSFLKREGSLSGRMLEVDADYDRRFVLVDSAVGNQIDRAIEHVSEQRKLAAEVAKNDDKAVNGWDVLQSELQEALYGKLGHLTRRYLLEAIKAKEVIPHVREHLALGRKVVVFHDFKKGGAVNPFDFRERTLPDRDEVPHLEDAAYAEMGPKIEAYNAAVRAFRQEFPELAGDTLLSDLLAPIERFKAEFPGVLLINGDEKKSTLPERYKRFQDDASGPLVMLVQSDKNKGWSGHDTTGKNQRVMFNLGLPTQPTKTIQQEGRIYRTGQVSNAIFRYLNTGTNWERWAFAETIAQRASAAENLGMGESARALKEAYIAGFEESSDYRAGHEGEGTGGKERDRLANSALTEYDRAKAFYWGTQKKDSRSKAQEGADYFATPEPLGLKMVQWADLRPGEDALEPSGGHGAIARWLPDLTNRTSIEPSSVLGSRLALVFDGKIIRGDFESHNVVNKYDGVVMNPPFGTAGRTAVDHVAKAATHLREGGRIVALIPTGPAADKKFDKWLYEEEQRPLKPLGTIDIDGKDAPIYKGDTIESRASWAKRGAVSKVDPDGVWVKVEGANGLTMVSKASITSVQPTGLRTESFSPAAGLYLVADIKLPAVTFERAGTQVMTRVVVLEKPGRDRQAPQQIDRDLSDIEDITELFDRLEDLNLAPRAKPVDDVPAAAAAEPAPRKAEKAEAQKAGAAVAAETGAAIVEHVTQKGKTIRGVIRTDLTKDQAQQVDPYTWKKDGGFFIRVEHLAKLNEKFPPPAPAGPQPVLSRSAPGSKGVPAEDLRRMVDTLAAGWQGLRARPEVVATTSALPQNIVDALRSMNALGTTRGLRMPDGKVYLIANKLGSMQEAQAVLFHEVYGHEGLRAFLGDAYIDTMGALRMANPELAKEANTWYASYGEDQIAARIEVGMSPDEAGALVRALAVEEALADRAGEGPVPKAWKTVMAALQKALRGIKRLAWIADWLESKTEAETYAVLMGARRAIERGTGDLVGPLTQEVAQGAPVPERSAAERTALQALSENDSLFKIKSLHGRTVSEIAFDLDPTITVKPLPAEGLRERWRVTLPEGGYGDITIRKPNPYGNDIYGFDLADGEMANVVTERPGENAQDVQDAEDVWIDVSQMKEGQGGDRIYAIAGALAHNTGRIFIGDPNGLSPVALRRRAENMLSLAMRYGTTEFLAPHPDQIKGDKALGVPPLRWVYGDDQGNAERLIALNIKAVENAFPDIATVDFDASAGTFVNARTRAPIDRNRLVGRALERRSEEETGSGLDSARAAGRTYARAVVLRSLSREAGSGTEGRGQGRNGVLARIGAAASGPGRANLTALFSRTKQQDSSEAPVPLLSQTPPNEDPVLTSAKRKAGLRGPRTLAQKIKAYYGRALDTVRDRNAIGENARQGMLDQFHGIRRAMQNELGNLPAEQDPYVTARLANGGTSSVMRALLLHGQARWASNGQHLEKAPDTKGLLDILKPLGDDLNDWFGWMVGNRAARLLTEGRENNLTEAEIKALQGLANTEDKLVLFRRAALEYAAFKRSVLDVAQEAGLIDASSRKVWDHADYIPFYRRFDESDLSATGGHRNDAAMRAVGRRGLAGQSSGIRQLKGGESDLNDPMENLLMGFSRLIDASLKNNAIKQTIDALGETDLVQKVGYDMAPAIIPRSQVVDELIRAGTPESIIATLPDEVFEGMAKMWSIKAPTDPDVVRVMVGGKPQFYRVEDALLLRSLTSFVPFTYPGQKALIGAKRLLTSMVTATPEFMLRNWIRDSLASQAITESPFSPTESVRGIRRAYKEQGGYEAMLFAGASFQSGNVDAGDPEATAVHMRRALRKRGMDAASIESFMGSIIDGTARGWEKYRSVGEAVENANREAVYEAAIKAGKTATQAAYEAKDLMDFSLRGDWALYQAAADVLPFLNARVQGLYRLGRSDRKRLLRVMMIMAAFTGVLMLFNSGEDWYERLPDWDKDANWHLMIFGQHLRIPKPFELGVLAATLPERIARGFMGLDSGKKTLGRVWANVRDQLAFDPVPQLFRPAVDAWANKDSFRDRPIEGMADEGKSPSARYDARTSDTMRVLADVAEPVADWAGLSPKKLEFLLNGYFGTVGMYTLAVADYAVRQVEGKADRPTLRLDDFPVIRAFYVVDPARATVFESDIYKMRRDLTEIVKEIRALETSNEEGSAERAKAKREKEAEKLKVRGVVEGAAQQLNWVNKEISRTYTDPKMGSDAKREKIDKLMEQKNALAQKTARRADVQEAF